MGFLVLAGIRAGDLVLISLGFALVFGTCRVLNLMHGSYVMLGAYTAHLAARQFAQHCTSTPFEQSLIVLSSATAVGMFGFATFKLLQLSGRTHPSHLLAISFVGNLLIASVVRCFFGTAGVNVSPILSLTIQVGGLSVPANDLLIPVVASVAVAAVWLWLKRTRSGAALRAVADNPTAARLAGIDPERMLALATGLASFLAGLSGALRSPSHTVVPDMWVHPLLSSFAVVVLGGRNSLTGTVLIACLLAGAETALAWYWTETAASYAALGVIVIGLLLRPSGLLGTPRYELR
jgi:branched-subunit amino acid ABC-type transport system permease component